MQEKYLFEYAVIRVVPRVEREEFLNVGVILFCAKQKFLKAMCQLDEERLMFLFKGHVDGEEVKDHLSAVENIAAGSLQGGPIAELDPASRFRWLTATRSTVVQTSKVHPGFSPDPQETLEKLYSQLVL